MDILQLIRIFQKNLILLISVPLALALLVIFLTRNPTFQYQSSTTIYTGIASGYTIEQKDRFDLFATNNAFDNLINVIKSRETLNETAVRLFAQGLSQNSYEKTIISKESFVNLRKLTPAYIKDMVVKPIFDDDEISVKQAYEQTVEKFIEYKNASDTNYIYNLLNFGHKHYSIYAISKIRVRRVQSSDLIEVIYQSDDPGITMQTLSILTDVFINNFRSLKENQSDAVVNYFQSQVANAQNRLKKAEEELLEFNTGNRIINYYEQSKFIAGKKEDIETAIQEERMKLAGAEMSLQNIENKLMVQGQIQIITDDIIVKRNKLIDITERLTINEIYNEPDAVSRQELARLRTEAEKLQEELNHDLNQLYSFSNSIEGMPIDQLLQEWLTNLIKLAEAKAGIEVLLNREEEFSKNYDLFAPLGATMSRIEREIDVAEREYLSLLASLNDAKLKQQNEQLSTNIKPLDPPFFPISAIPSKRKILVLAAGMAGFIIVAFGILLTEYFDNTIKTVARAERYTGLKTIGVMPKIVGKYKAYNLSFIINRLIELLLLEIKNITHNDDEEIRSQSRLIVLFSTTDQEGKSFIADKLVAKLRAIGDRVLYMNYAFQNPEENENRENKATKLKTQISGLLGKLTGFLPQSENEKTETLLQSVQNIDNLTYRIGNNFPEIHDLFDLIKSDDINSFDNFKYVFMEIPAILYNFYPSEIIGQSDLNIMVLRSNREWKNADIKALNMFKRASKNDPVVLLNGVEIEEIEAVLGNLPKKRSKLRRMIKQLIKLQFYTKSTIK
jgi:polysaccharide biosynthesis transport protein